MLSKQEMEISINKCAADKEFSIYCTDPKYIRHMKKIGIEPYKTELIDGEVAGCFYKVPIDQVKIIKKRKKIQLSEERKRELAERMILVKNSKKNS